MKRYAQGLGDAPMPSETAKLSMDSPKAITRNIQKSVIIVIIHVFWLGVFFAAEFYHFSDSWTLGFALLYPTYGLSFQESNAIEESGFSTSFPRFLALWARTKCVFRQAQDQLFEQDDSMDTLTRSVIFVRDNR